MDDIAHVRGASTAAAVCGVRLFGSPDTRQSPFSGVLASSHGPGEPLSSEANASVDSSTSMETLDAALGRRSGSVCIINALEDEGDRPTCTPISLGVALTNASRSQLNGEDLSPVRGRDGVN